MTDTRLTDCLKNDCPAREWSEEIKKAVALLEENQFQLFYCPSISIGGYMRNMEHDLSIYRKREMERREEERLKEERRKARKSRK